MGRAFRLQVWGTGAQKPLRQDHQMNSNSTQDPACAKLLFTTYPQVIHRASSRPPPLSTRNCAPSSHFIYSQLVNPRKPRIDPPWKKGKDRPRYLSPRGRQSHCKHNTTICVFICDTMLVYTTRERKKWPEWSRRRNTPSQKRHSSFALQKIRSDAGFETSSYAVKKNPIRAGEVAGW